MSAMRRKNRELRRSSQSAKNHGAVSIAQGTVAFIEKSAFLPLYAITVNNQSLLCPPYMYNYIELFLQKYCEHIHNNV